MAGYGFIRDKLDIKFLILYIAARVIEPIPFDTVLDLTLCDDAIDYFDFSECLQDLVKTEHLALSEDGLTPLQRRACGTARSARAVWPTPCVCAATRIWRSGTANCAGRAR